MKRERLGGFGGVQLPDYGPTSSFTRHPDFDLVPMLIGRGGRNMRDIYVSTNAKLRIRGRGSGHLEIDGRKEAPVPLMVAVTSMKNDPEGFRKAIEQALVRLKEVAAHYEQFCIQRGLPPPRPTEPLFSFGEISKGSEMLLKDLLLLHPHPNGPRSAKKVTPGGIAPGGMNPGGIAPTAGGDQGAQPAASVDAQPEANSRPSRIRSRKKHCKESSLPTAPAAEVAAAEVPTPNESEPQPQQQPVAVTASNRLLAMPIHDYGNSGTVPDFQWHGFQYVPCADLYGAISTRIPASTSSVTSAVLPFILTSNWLPASEDTSPTWAPPMAPPAVPAAAATTAPIGPMNSKSIRIVALGSNSAQLQPQRILGPRRRLARQLCGRIESCPMSWRPSLKEMVSAPPSRRTTPRPC